MFWPLLISPVEPRLIILIEFVVVSYCRLVPDPATRLRYESGFVESNRPSFAVCHEPITPV